MAQALLSSKVVIQEEEPQLRQIEGRPTNVTGFVGVTEKGPIGSAVLVQSPAEYRRTYGGYTANGEVAQAIDGFFQNGGKMAYISRVVHMTDVTNAATKTSAVGTQTLLTGATSPSAGYSESSLSEPFQLTAGATLIVTPDGGSPSTATFSATAAARESAAGTFNLSGGKTLTVAIDGGTVQSIAFVDGNFASPTAATVAEVAAVINGVLVGGRATLTSGGTKVTISSDKLGTSSGVNVTGGTANSILSFTTGNIAGTGNVANILAVTVAEVKTVVEAAVSGVTVTNSSSKARITSNTTGGSSSVLVGASSTADTLMGFDNATHTGSSGSAVSTLRTDGKWDGAYANALSVKIADATSGDTGRFNLQVLKAGVVIENWTNLSMDDADPLYVETVLNNADTGSEYIAVVDLDAATTATGQRPANGTFTLAGGSDGLSSLSDSDFTGAVGTSTRSGLRCLDLVQDLALLVIPGRATSAVHNAMLSYCETTRNGSVFALLDPPAATTAAGMVTYVETTAALLNFSEFGAIYWPRIQVMNPNKTVFGNTDNITVSPAAYVAGICARNDLARDGGVYDAPAGTEQGVIQGCLGFETDECLDEDKRDLLAPARVNPLTTGPGLPRFVDGSDTLKATGNFPSVSERRGVIYIEQSIKGGLQFARHKNNDEALRARCDRTVRDFLNIQMKNRAFRSMDPKKAYLCDFGDGLNPPAQQFAGKLIGRVGLATQKPAKFIIVKFSQDTRAFTEGNA